MEFSHIDEEGKARMVDVSEKDISKRVAVARGFIWIKPEVLKQIKDKSMPKGDVLAVAQLAGIMAGKQTPNLIPLCHPLIIGDIKIEFHLDEDNSTVEIITTVKGIGKTGVEMEALTATAVAALTIYDMAKAIDPSMRIDGIRLIKKSGGKSGALNLE